MQKNKVVVNSQKRFDQFIEMCNQKFNSKNPWFVGKIESNKRKVEQNALQFHWYRELFQQGAAKTIPGIRNECKLLFGIPILRVKDPDFNSFWVANIEHLGHEVKLDLMEYTTVTSEFNIEEMTDFLNQVKYHYTDAGYTLTSREDL